MQDNDLRSQIQKAKELAGRLITFDEVPQPKSQEVKESTRLDVTQYVKEIKPEGDKVKITVEIPMKEYLNTDMGLSVSVHSHVDKGE